MSKNFEKEYKEYLNAQAPDLWDRIEAGVDALERATAKGQDGGTEEVEALVSSSTSKTKKERKKRRIRYQHYRMIASVAACLFALVIIVPVYLFTRQNQKSEMATDSVPQKIENVTIENLVVDASESEPAVEESAPMEEVSDGTAQIEIPSDVLVEESVQATDMTGQSGTDSADVKDLGITGGAESGEQVAQQQMPPEDGVISEILQESEAEQEVEMTVTIQGEGIAWEGGVMYTAVKSASESSETVSLFVPEEKMLTLAADGVYVISAKLSEDALYYNVESATQQ